MKGVQCSVVGEIAVTTCKTVSVCCVDTSVRYPIVCIIVYLYGLVAAVPLQPLVGGLGLLEVFETLYTIAVEE